MRFDDVIEEYENKAKQSSKSIDRMEQINAKKYQQIADWIKELKLFRTYASDDLIVKIAKEM